MFTKTWKCGRHKTRLKQDGLEMRWEDLVFSFMSLHNGWIKVQIFYGETRSSTKVKCPRTPVTAGRRYICTVYCVPVNVERWNMDRKWTPNLVYQRILKLETWRKSGSQCLGQMSVSSKIQSISVSLHFWFNEILPLWIWGYIYFLCGNPFKFRRRKKLCSADP